MISATSTGSHGQTSWIMAAFLLINAALGAGLLNYPVAYDRLGGIGYATVIQFGVVILMASTIMTLIYCAQICNENSYHGVMNEMCGKLVMQLSAASISITCFGICVTFVIIIGDQFDRIFATYIGKDFCGSWFMNRSFTMLLTTMATIWPMCYFRRLDFLRHVNVLGVIASFYIIFLNGYSYYKLSDQEAPPMRTTPASGLEFTAALPVVFFAYQTHEIVIPVYDSMTDKSTKAFFKSTTVALAVLLLLYCIAGTFGYMTFGSKVAPDIMLMYDANDLVVLVGIVALIVKIITTYPPVVFCGRDTLVRIIIKRMSKSKLYEYECLDDGRSRLLNEERKVTILVTTIWNIFVLILAIIIPNITIAIGFLGSLASCNVFIFPGLALIALTKRYGKLKQNFHKQRQSVLAKQRQNGSCSSEPEYCDSSRDSPLSRGWIQRILFGYGLFIIGMGIVMFVIILIQVYHDLQSQAQHDPICVT